MHSRLLVALIAASLSAPAWAATRTAVVARAPAAELFTDGESPEEAWVSWKHKVRSTAHLVGRQVQYDAGMRLVKDPDRSFFWAFDERSTDTRMLRETVDRAVEQLLVVEASREGEQVQLCLRRIHREGVRESVGCVSTPEGTAVEAFAVFEQALNDTFAGVGEAPANLDISVVDSRDGKVIEGARAEVSGAGIATASRSHLAVEAGAHRVLVAAGGYVGAEVAVQVQSGEDRPLTIELDRLATLYVSAPKRADVMVDGQDAVGPSSFPIHPGRTLEVVARSPNGARCGSESVQLAPGEEAEVKVKLKRCR